MRFPMLTALCSLFVGAVLSVWNQATLGDDHIGRLDLTLDAFDLSGKPRWYQLKVSVGRSVDLMNQSRLRAELWGRVLQGAVQLTVPSFLCFRTNPTSRSRLES